jgi:hypothetical protein
MSDTIQSAESFSTDIGIKFLEYAKGIVNIDPREVVSHRIEARDAAISADEARKQEERYAAVVAALKDIDAQFHAQELADKLIDSPCPRYQCASVYIDISKTRKAFADLEATK